MMDIEKYDRKPFSVEAVQVHFENVNEIAVWCKGTVIKQKTKMLGVDTEVPAIRVDGQGDNRGKSFIATLGCYVVCLKGSYRVYKPAQFESSFAKAQQLVGTTVLDEALQDAQDLEGVYVEHLIEDEPDNSSVAGQETAVA
jgi:hypothetical protein